jgi:hypothetical protein
MDESIGKDMKEERFEIVLVTVVILTPLLAVRGQA